VALDSRRSVTGGPDRPTARNYQVNIGASWEPDVWGRLGRTVASARAGEQASVADLQAAKLSAQGELASDYFNLRELDAQIALQQQTIVGFESSFRIAQNRYNAGIVARTDVLQAETQLANARADLLGLERQRATLEHAIAVLVGKAPANFSLQARPAWQGVVPDVPIDVPSTLLQRRPDIAAAERRAAQANEQIGIAQAAYFPSVRLSGSVGLGAASIGDLFSASALAWSLGASLAQTLFNAGATTARVESARAGLDEAAARYRQTVLTAFQQVEDQLVASRILQAQLALREQSAQAANLVEQQVLNRYKAGQVSFTEVVTAQITAQNARSAVARALSDRQVAAVALIQALGGGWRGI
jgi:NodT family efflux transporter outer membrane factor (OMF) lipoprotein